LGGGKRLHLRRLLWRRRRRRRLRGRLPILEGRARLLLLLHHRLRGHHLSPLWRRLNHNKWRRLLHRRQRWLLHRPLLLWRRLQQRLRLRLRLRLRRLHWWLGLRRRHRLLLCWRCHGLRCIKLRCIQLRLRRLLVSCHSRHESRQLQITTVGLHHHVGANDAAATPRAHEHWRAAWHLPGAVTGTCPDAGA
jgi:hypothetical protein